MTIATVKAQIADLEPKEKALWRAWDEARKSRSEIYEKWETAHSRLEALKGALTVLQEEEANFTKNKP